MSLFVKNILFRFNITLIQILDYFDCQLFDAKTTIMLLLNAKTIEKSHLQMNQTPCILIDATASLILGLRF